MRSGASTTVFHAPHVRAAVLLPTLTDGVMRRGCLRRHHRIYLRTNTLAFSLCLNDSESFPFSPPAPVPPAAAAAAAAPLLSASP